MGQNEEKKAQKWCFSGRGIIVLFFGPFYYFSVFFRCPPPLKIFLPTLLLLNEMSYRIEIKQCGKQFISNCTFVFDIFIIFIKF